MRLCGAISSYLSDHRISFLSIFQRRYLILCYDVSGCHLGSQKLVPYGCFINKLSTWLSVGCRLDTNLFCSQGNVMVGIVILFLAAEDSASGHCLHTEAHGSSGFKVIRGWLKPSSKLNITGKEESHFRQSNKIQHTGPPHKCFILKFGSTSNKKHCERKLISWLLCWRD